MEAVEKAMTIQYISKHNISLWYPRGILTLERMVKDLNEFVELEKKYSPFNRFSNLTEADFSQIKYEDVRQIYLLRRAEYKSAPVKTVFLVKTDLQFGIARIYQTLMADTPINVEIFKTPQECANHLNVPLEVILPA